jgi:phosphoribosylglycinamide formyltransferase-1
VRLAVLVSGSGTLLAAMLEEGIPIAVVASDRQCVGLERAEKAGVPALLVARKSFGAEFDRHGYTQQMVEVLQEHDIDLVAMAGFGTVFAEPMQKAYGGRILNTHPSLLPAFPGWHAVREALAHGVKVTGCTVHVAGLEVDTGPILTQEAVPVLPGDTEESLHERIKVVERRIYPATIKAILERGSVQ